MDKIRKKVQLFLILLLIPSYLYAQSENIELQDQESLECSHNYSSLVFQENNGVILSQTRSDEKIYPASLVKLMTVYLTFEAIKEGDIRLNQKIMASGRAESISAVNKVNTLKLKEGDVLSVDEAIKGSIVKSFNEATIMLAEAISGSEWDFVRKMNSKSKELGMYHSNFRNASGLHDDGQFTTNYDLARLAIALKNDFPEYYPLFSLKEFTYSDKRYVSHNHILFDYKGAEGMKTGFTRMSGFNLIAVAKQNDERIVSILTSCASYQKRDEFTKELFDSAFYKISQDHESDLEVKIAYK